MNYTKTIPLNDSIDIPKFPELKPIVKDKAIQLKHKKCVNCAANLPDEVIDYTVKCSYCGTEYIYQNNKVIDNIKFVDKSIEPIYFADGSYYPKNVVEISRNIIIKE